MTANRPAEGLSVLDHAVLLANAGGDRMLAAELLALFATEILPAAEGLAGLGHAAEQRAAAHRVRGAALAIGAAELAAAAMAIEEGAGAEGFALALQRLRPQLSNPWA